MNSKRTIFKNTAYLYLSSIIILFLGLYTSRILIQTLGVKDFGLYGVVGSIVSLLSFLNIAMSSSSSRYLTYELAKGNIASQRQVYSSVFFVHLILALCLLLLAETLGLWYLLTKLEVPEGRETAAMWVYQSSIIIGVINIIQVPYNALINAHEKMGYSSMLQTFNNLLKFIGVISFYWITFDRLIYYSFIMTLLSLLVFLCFLFYSKKKFAECRLILSSADGKLFREILSFAGFSAFSSSSGLVRIQGSNLIINKYFGVVVNASANIANSVVGYLSAFTQTVITAFRPQIIKNYAQENITSMQDDINCCLKYCVAIYSIMAVPVFLEMRYLLYVWLGQVPANSDLFCRIGLIGCLFSLVNMIMTIGIQATSKVKQNSLLITLLTAISLLTIIYCMFMGFQSFTVFLVNAVTEFAIMLVSTINLKKLIPQIRLKQVFKMLAELLLLVAVSGALTLAVKNTMAFSFLRFLSVTFVYITAFVILFWFKMLNLQTRKQLVSLLIRKFSK